MITTPSGTTVDVKQVDGLHVVILDNPAAPDDMRNVEAGRITEGGFQPAMLSAFGMSPTVLRAIADLIEQPATLAEHDEVICSAGTTMCHECYAAGGK
jgi:hypothetical protein